MIGFGGIYQQRRDKRDRLTDFIVLQNEKNFFKVPCAFNGMKATAKTAATLAIS